MIELKDRTLWYDGSISIDPKDIQKYIRINNLFVTHLTDDIKQYNRNVVDTDRIMIKSTLNDFDTRWNIPESYFNIDVFDYINNKFLTSCNEFQFSDNEVISRFKRIKSEYAVFNKLGLNDLLRTLIYIIDKFKQNNIVWGVGRGSSVSSYILYLMEVHDIDSIEYDLDFTEFLGDLKWEK